MATARPLALLGAEPVTLEVGAVADLAIFRLSGADGNGAIGDFEVVATINSGQLVFGSLPTGP